MRARPLVVVGLTAAALGAPAPALAAGAAAIADSLRGDSVYVDPAVRSSLSSGDERRLERDIARRDRGRIKLAVVSPRTATQAGGVAALANALDRRLGAPGTVIVHAGPRLWLVTAYPDSQGAQAAVQQAFDAHRRLAAQLAESISGIASIDPGPSREVPSRSVPLVIPTPRIPTVPAPPARTSHGSSSAATIAIVVGTAAPFLVWGLIVLRRSLRTRREARETFEDDLADARQQLVALGDDIGELDLDTSMPNADATGKHEYEQALDQYQRAERLLGEDANPRRLARANAALGEGRRLMDSARSRLERT